MLRFSEAQTDLERFVRHFVLEYNDQTVGKGALSLVDGEIQIEILELGQPMFEDFLCRSLLNAAVNAGDFVLRANQSSVWQGYGMKRDSSGVFKAHASEVVFPSQCKKG